MVKKFFSLFLLGAIAFSVSAKSDFLSPYVGLESRISSIHNGGGGKTLMHVLPQTYYGGGAFVGNRFSDNFGIEFSYDVNRVPNKKHSLDGLTIDLLDPDGGGGNGLFTGGAVLAKIAEVTGTHLFDLKTRLDGWNLDAIGYLPITDSFDLIASLGVSELRYKLKGSITLDGSLVNPEPTLTAVALSLGRINAAFSAGGIIQPVNETHTKIVPRIGFGAQYTKDRFGVRGMFRFTNTDRKFKSKTYGNLMKNMYSFNLGVFMKFA